MKKNYTSGNICAFMKNYQIHERKAWNYMHIIYYQTQREIRLVENSTELKFIP